MSALPTFLVIGGHRCATTSMHHYLGEHPEIQVSRPKELHFWVGGRRGDLVRELTDERERAKFGSRRSNSYRGMDWYRSHFDPAFPVRGESSPSYASPWYPDTAERIAAGLPDVRLIYCVRDPVARALSGYRFAVARRAERRPPEDALHAGSSYVLRSRYAHCIEPYLATFPRDRILIVQSERLDSDRAAVMREAFAFLGVDDGFRSDAWERRWNVGAGQGGTRFRAMMRLRRIRGSHAVVKRLPRGAFWLAERLTRRTDERSAPPAASAAVVELLREDAARFRAAVGLDFPGWSV